MFYYTRFWGVWLPTVICILTVLPSKKMTCTRDIWPRTDLESTNNKYFAKTENFLWRRWLWFFIDDYDDCYDYYCYYIKLPTSFQTLKPSSNKLSMQINISRITAITSKLKTLSIYYDCSINNYNCNTNTCNDIFTTYCPHNWW